LFAARPFRNVRPVQIDRAGSALNKALLFGRCLHASASTQLCPFRTTSGHADEKLRLIGNHSTARPSLSWTMALVGQAGSQRPQSMHNVGSITSMTSPAAKQLTGQTSTHSMNLQRMQASVTT
jgi:hypothetical protein